MTRTIAITATNGRLGRAVAQELLRRHLTDINLRFTARDPKKLEGLKGQILCADYDKPTTLKVAFTGVDTLLLISSMGTNEERIRHHRAAIDAARATGVKRIVYTSFVNPVTTSRFIWAWPHADTEVYLKASGIPYTILRDNQYCANLDPLLNQAKETGVLTMPGLHGKVAYISHEDVAAAAVETLLGKGHENRIYELTGPVAVDGLQIAGALSKAVGKEIKAVEASPESFRAFFRASGMPEYAVEGLSSLYEAAGAGEYRMVSKDAEALIGRPTTSVLEFVAKTMSHQWMAPTIKATKTSRPHKIALPGSHAPGQRHTPRGGRP